ncbi:MAG: hypothetical protein IJ565_04165 [Bacilli bacterium]|nr:hypothetical protein [Bacilli bacterium]
MENIDYSKYNLSDENLPICFVKIIENEIGMSYKEIRGINKDADVKVTEDEIKEFLSSELETNKEHIRKEQESLARRFGNNDPVIIKATENFGYNLVISKYKYEPYTYQYFKKYIGILKEKNYIFFDLIDMLANLNIGIPLSDEKIKELKELLESLDITLTSDYRISKEDVVRIVDPFIYNLKTIIETTKKANSLETYLDFKINEDSIYKNGMTEEMVYPSTELQIKNIDIPLCKGYVPLTKKQEEEIQSRNDEYSEYTIQLLKDM